MKTLGPPIRAAGLPELAVVVSAVLWGLWWLPLRALAEAGLPGEWASFVVYGLAGACMLPFLRNLRGRLAAGGLGLLVSGGLMGLALVLWNHALLVGEVVRVVLLFYLAPVWATLLGLFVLAEPAGAWRWLAVFAGLAGAAVVLGLEGGFPLPRDMGDWTGLGAGLVFAFSVTATRRAGSVGSLEKTLVAFAVAALLAGLLAPFGPFVHPTGAELLEALPLGLAIALVWILPGTWLMLWAAGHLNPGRVSILLLLEVVVSAISAGSLTDEPFGLREALGCVLILLAGFAEAVPDLRRRPAAGGR